MIDNPTGKGKLLKYSISGDTWNDCNLPRDAERRYRSQQPVHALTMYGSKLLLIGSADSDSLREVDTVTAVFSFKVWEFSAATSTFEPSPDITPPLDTCTSSQSKESRHVSIAAASRGECLIVSEKSQIKNTQCCMQLTFDGVTWQMHNGPCLHVQSTHQLLFHNHSIFLIENIALHYGHDSISHIFEASLQSLFDNDPDPWQLLKSTVPFPSRSCMYSNIITVETHLSLVSYSHKEFKVWNYFVNSARWQEAGCAKAPFHSTYDLERVHTVRLPDESLMTICCRQHQTMVYKLRPKCEQLLIIIKPNHRKDMVCVTSGVTLGLQRVPPVPSSFASI